MDSKFPRSICNQGLGWKTLTQILRLICLSTLLAWLIQDKQPHKNHKERTSCSVFGENPGDCFCNHNGFEKHYPTLLSVDIDQYNHSLGNFSECFQNQTLHLVGGSAVEDIFQAIIEELNANSLPDAAISMSDRLDYSSRLSQSHFYFSNLPVINTTTTLNPSDSVVNPQARVDGQDGAIVGWLYRVSHAHSLQQEVHTTDDSLLEVLHQVLLRKEVNDLVLARLGRMLDERITSDLLVLVDAPHDQAKSMENRTTKILTTLISKVPHLVGEEYRVQIMVDANRTMSDQSVLSERHVSLPSSKLHTTKPLDLLNILCKTRTNLQSIVFCTARDSVLIRYSVVRVLFWAITLEFLDLITFRSQFVPKQLISLNSLVTALAYCLVADRTTLFEKSPKTVDVKAFVICIAACLVMTAKYWTRPSFSDQAKFIDLDVQAFSLPRDQTEEWKGWMQAVILLYHYFGLSKVLWVYQLVRVLVASYLFLTGYSHTKYFLKTKDFSFGRVAKVLTRLNLLSCILSYVMNNPWDFYYFPALSSFWFLVVFVALWSVKFAVRRTDFTTTVIGLTASCCFVQTTLVTSTGELMWSKFLAFICHIGGPQINKHEFLFRIKLDSLVPFVGALLAVISAKINVEPDGKFSLIARSLEKHSKSNQLVMFFVLVAAISYFWCLQFFEDKAVSNKWHPYLSAIPIILYLVFRNSSASRRHGFNRAFKWLGSISLETYILQSHIWLANDNKQVLRLEIFEKSHHEPGYKIYDWIDRAIVTCFFLLISHAVANTTRSLTGWLTAGSMYRLYVFVVCCWLLNMYRKTFD